MATKTQEQVFGEIEGRLVAKFSTVPAAHVANVVGATRERFAGSRIQDFVPLLVERGATRELSAVSAAMV